MAKSLTDKALGEIVYRATHDSGEIDDADAYQHFLEDLGRLVADHFGGTFDGVALIERENSLPGEQEWGCLFSHNECVPDDGGVYKRYDDSECWLTFTGEIRITSALRERAGVERGRGMNSAALRFAQGRADVAFRPYCDHWDVYNQVGNWAASFSDASVPGELKFENISVARGVTLSLPDGSIHRHADEA